jgi:hypothetical protein
MTIVNTIGVGGLVHQRSPLGPRELSAAVTTDERGVGSIELVDVLAMMRVDVGADVLVATDMAGASLAIPIRQVVIAAVARIEFGIPADHANDGGLRADRPILLVTDWTDDRSPFVVASLHALSFGVFLAGTYR